MFHQQLPYPLFLIYFFEILIIVAHFPWFARIFFSETKKALNCLRSNNLMLQMKIISLF